MGVDAADLNGDGRQDLFVANVDQEMFSLYQNEGNESFRDVAAPNGVAQATRLLSGWGLKFFDYDNDGQLDLLLSNGHPDDMIEKYSTQVTYKEPLLLFRNEGGRLKDVSAGSGPVSSPRVTNAVGTRVPGAHASTQEPWLDQWACSPASRGGKPPNVLLPNPVLRRTPLRMSRTSNRDAPSACRHKARRTLSPI
jgi:hypothetical protein